MSSVPKTSIKFQSKSRLPFAFPDGIVVGERRLNADDISFIKSIELLTITISPFICSGFEFNGGSIEVVPNGIWYIGVEISSKQLRALPRLGHRGWIPIAKVISNAQRITDFEEITPVLPKTRIPRTLRKLAAGKSIKALIMGSSLTEGSGSTNWTGLVFGGSVDAYGLPNSPSFTNIGLGGTPNAYQLCQLGFATSFSGSVFNESCVPNSIFGKKSPNGRSTIFSDIDVVVIGLLANGGDYRLDIIEPLIRNLRKLNLEVIVTTDNPQNPTNSFSTMVNSALHVDGPEVLKITDHYGVEFADTSAYVLESHLRKNGVGIFADSIHMSTATPAGPNAVAPNSGHEAWARAIRSIFSIQGIAGQTTSVVNNYNFNDGTIQGWFTYNGTKNAVANEGNSLKISKNIDTADPWGGQIGSANVNTGDTVVVTGTITYDTGIWGSSKPSIGLQGGGGGWGSNSVVVNSGEFNITLTASRPATNSTLLVFGNWDSAPNGTSVSIDNIQITVNNAATASVVDTVSNRESETKVLPNSRLVTDIKTPADATIILPSDEWNIVANTGAKGVLGGHPGGTSSFARRFNSGIASNQDLLTITTGQKVTVAGYAVVGFSLILYSQNGNGQATFDVHTNGALRKSMTVGVQTLSREIYLPVLSPAELNNTNVSLGNQTIDITCTSGTIRIAAMVALTAEHELINIDAASRNGTWSSTKVSGGSPNMPGYATDVLGSYLSFKCPDNARRVGWICTAKPNGKPINTWSGQSTVLGTASSGINHVRVYGGLVGRGEYHHIQCAENATVPGDSTNGYALHVGGIVVCYDR